ncbi:YbaN family protein [Sphingomonas sanguinis]|uniref:YbaN family protein n=1 Tax=Sphingomonas sanguinis TaxID=33051 RepID=UPI0009ED93E2|nr:YbaN family protein [Sphingomonas sanguinis]
MTALREGSRVRRAIRFGWLALGVFCVGLGIVGALLPLMPTTIFLILAAGCFARSSPRLEAWLLDHPRFGPTLRAWRRDGAMSRRAKGMACGGMAIGYAIFLLTARPNAVLAIVVAFVMIGCATYIGTRPNAA